MVFQPMYHKSIARFIMARGSNQRGAAHIRSDTRTKRCSDFPWGQIISGETAHSPFNRKWTVLLTMKKLFQCLNSPVLVLQPERLRPE